MNHFWTFSLAFLLVFPVLAQTKQTVPIGSRTQTSGEIMATEYVFEERFENFYIDTMNGNIAVPYREIRDDKLKNKGFVTIYDRETLEFKWRKKINYLSSVFYVNGMYFFSDKSMRRVDPQTGKKIWSTPHTLVTSDPDRNIGLGYHWNDHNRLSGIDLDSGEVLWDRMIRRSNGWNDFQLLPDSAYLITAGGLHRIDPRTGKGWDYDAETDFEKFNWAGLIGTVAGFGMGMLTGTFVVPVGYGSNVLVDLASNTLVDDGTIYFADLEKITARRPNGIEKWAYAFPKRTLSKSVIFVYEDLLCLVNFGFGYRAGNPIGFGVPFISAFDKETGEQIYYHEISDKNRPVWKVSVKEDEIYMIFADEIVRYSVRYGTVISSIEQDDVYENRVFSFLSEDALIRHETGMRWLVRENPENNYLFNRSEVLELGPRFAQSKKIPLDSVYLPVYATDRYLFLWRQPEEITVWDQHWREVARFRGSKNTRPIGNKLYYSNENTITEIDLSLFLESGESIENLHGIAD